MHFNSCYICNNVIFYTFIQLFRTHMDHLERAKIVMGSDRMEVSNSPRSK